MTTIFIASPGDVSRERRQIEKRISEWNLRHAEASQHFFVPKLWEMNLSHGGYDPQGGQHLIDAALLAKADACIAVFWTTLGQTKVDGKSGTAHEIDVVRQSNKPTYVWFKDTAVPTGSDYSRRLSVEKYRQQLQRAGHITSNFLKTGMLDEMVDSVLFELSRQFPLDSPSGEVIETRGTTYKTFFRASLRRATNVGHLSLENIGETDVNVDEVVLFGDGGSAPIFGVNEPSGYMAAGETWNLTVHFPMPSENVSATIKFTHPDFGAQEEKIDITLK
ncbi:hypothetical protein [Rathayibacter caricis]|uniref:hypothetical protein n=1 Tax=Rathayibacter caricis TaxID=110936 RepID=UPI0011B1CBEB|nr:hypothetical protein [Rathayibacter caricis]